MEQRRAVWLCPGRAGTNWPRLAPSSCGFTGSRFLSAILQLKAGTPTGDRFFRKTHQTKCILLHFNYKINKYMQGICLKRKEVKRTNQPQARMAAPLQPAGKMPTPRWRPDGCLAR